MSKILKYTLLGLSGAVLCFCIVCSYFAGRSQRKSNKCERLEVRVLDSLENHFISSADVKMVLDKTYGEYIGISADSINLVKVEEIVERRSAVNKSEAYMTCDGTLHIDVTQRKPVVRFQKKDGGFYADAEGYIFPLQNSFASHVQIIDGHIPLAANSGYKGEIADPAEKEWFNRIMELVNFLEEKKEWKDKIVQIHVSENGDLILIPRIGNERFIYGPPDKSEEKFEKIKKYYSAIVPEMGYEKYSEVDLRFNGQIICR
jgi:cell division protein FtsQ